MSTLWHKVWGDLWLSRSRTVLAVVSIAMGIVCLGTIFGMLDLQLSKMDAAHQQSQPSHINLILNGEADASLLEEIRTLPGVAGVDSLSQLTVYFRRSGANEWTLATLIIRADYQKQGFDQTVLAAGEWPRQGSLAIENLSAQFTGLGIGDQLEFQTAAGTQQLPILGVVRHPFVKPPKFGGQVHFFADASGGSAFGVAANHFRQLLVQITAPYSEEQARSLASDIRAVLAKHHLAANATLLQDPQRHWGRPFLAAVNDVLELMAITALALASVLIANTMTAHLALQRNQIGVLKALGASSYTVSTIYLGETLLMACLATLIAVPIALAAAYFTARHLLGLFNIDFGAFDYSPRAVLYMLLGGLFVPVMAAMAPILHSAQMTVRQAIADYGLGGDFGGHRFDLWLERNVGRWLPTLYAVAFCNLFRRKASLMLTQSVLIIAGTSFMVLMSLIASLHLTLDHEQARSQFAVRLSFAADQNAAQVIDIAHSLPATEAVELWQRLPVALAKDGKTIKQKGSLGLQILALPAAAALYQPLIESGRWLEASDAGKTHVVISADTAQLNGIQVGDSLEISIGLHKQAWQVIGIYRWLVAGNYVVEPVYAPSETLRTITQSKNQASLALIKAAVTNPVEEADLLKLLTQDFQDHGIKLDVYNTQAKLEQNQFTHNQFNPVIGTLSGLAAMIAVVGGIGLSGALAISVLQRIREIGVLSAIGASPSTIYRLFLLEGLLHGVLAWLLSIPLAYLAAEPIAEALGKTMLGIKLDFAFDANAVFYWLAIVLLLAWIASYWPARKAANLTVRQCLQH